MLAILLTLIAVVHVILNYCLRELSLLERVLFVISAGLLMTFIFTEIYPLFVLGVVLMVFLFIEQWMKTRADKVAAKGGLNSGKPGTG